jgi:site-specific recombinase XerD
MKESPNVLKEFFGYMETVKGKSPRTVEEYFLDLRTFFRYLKQSRGTAPRGCDFSDIEISDVDLDFLSRVTLTEVFQYMNFLASVRKNGPAARSRKCSSIRALFNYLTAKTGKLEVNPVAELENPKLKSSLPKFLTLEQSIDLTKNIEGSHKERDYCIITLFLNCGMRLSELVGINMSDMLSDNRLRITGKGNKQRMIYLNSASADAVRAYLTVRPVDGVKDRDALFLSSRKQRISPKTVQYIVKTHLSSINLGQSMSVHKLRHTAATLMYQHGDVDIRVLQDILGHESLGTTQIYTHVSDERVKDAIDKNPLSKIKN